MARYFFRDLIILNLTVCNYKPAAIGRPMLISVSEVTDQFDIQHKPIVPVQPGPPGSTEQGKKNITYLPYKP